MPLFGVSTYPLPAELTASDIEAELESWQKSCRLRKLSQDDGVYCYRHGNPWLSNPILIDVDLRTDFWEVRGQVSTSSRTGQGWLFVHYTKLNLLSALDLRRRGGLYVHRLIQRLAILSGETS